MVAECLLLLVSGSNSKHICWLSQVPCVCFVHREGNGLGRELSVWSVCQSASQLCRPRKCRWNFDCIKRYQGWLLV